MKYTKRRLNDSTARGQVPRLFGQYVVTMRRPEWPHNPAWAGEFGSEELTRVSPGAQDRASPRLMGGPLSGWTSVFSVVSYKA
jgi:hypothetical protein